MLGCFGWNKIAKKWKFQVRKSKCFEATLTLKFNVSGALCGVSVVRALLSQRLLGLDAGSDSLQVFSQLSSDCIFSVWTNRKNMLVPTQSVQKQNQYGCCVSIRRTGVFAYFEPLWCRLFHTYLSPNWDHLPGDICLDYASIHTCQGCLLWQPMI